MTLIFIACLILASCSAAPTTSDDLVITRKLTEDLIVTDKFFIDDFVIYTSKHDIVKMYVPLKQFNFDVDEIEITGSSSSSEEVKENYTLFFVEADVTKDETKYQGLYVLKDGKATKLVDNGRDAVANHENVIFIATEKGLYKYNETTNTADAFGTTTDNIIQLAHNNKTNAIYFLTEDHKVFKLNKDGDDRDEVTTLKDVQAMVFGFEGNMYYYDSKNDLYVYDVEVVGSVPKKVEGLPSEFSKLALISPIYGVEVGTLLAVDSSLYLIDPKATSEKLSVKFEAKPTASAPQPTLIQYYAKDKKIYEFNVLLILLGSILEELKEQLKPIVESYTEAITTIKKMSRA